MGELRTKVPVNVRIHWAAYSFPCQAQASTFASSMRLSQTKCGDQLFECRADLGHFQGTRAPANTTSNINVTSTDTANTTSNIGKQNTTRTAVLMPDENVTDAEAEFARNTAVCDVTSTSFINCLRSTDKDCAHGVGTDSTDKIPDTAITASGQ